MHTKPLVYIAGPYSHPDPVENTHKAIRMAELIEEWFDVGVVIPHLSLAWHLVSPALVDVWYARDLHLLERCDALFRMNGASTGADREVTHARLHGIAVFCEGEYNTAMAAWRRRWVSR